MCLLTKFFRTHCYGLAAFILILLAVSIRLAFISLDWPPTDSDEGTMGIMALHIAYHGEHPIFFYGQGYMGSLEAYLGTIFFHLFGSSVFTLRLGTILMFACFLSSMYFLTSLLYTKKLALVTLTLLTFGSSEMLFRQLEAAGGYPETLLFGSFLLLYATWLALSSQQEPTIHKTKWRLLAYAGFGSIIGLALWSDILILPFILMSCLLVVIFCLRDMRIRRILCFMPGLIISLLPTIIYNLSVPLNQGSFTFLGIIFIHAPGGQVIAQPSLLQKIAGTILVSLPLATGASTLCPITPKDAWPLSAQPSTHTLLCTAIHGAWGLGFLVLWAIAVILVASPKQGGDKLDKPGPYYDPVSQEQAFVKKMYLTKISSIEDRQTGIRQCARLMLLGSAGLTLLIYLLSAPSALEPWPGSRYLVGLQIAVPAVIAPLWGMSRSQNVGSVRLLFLRGPGQPTTWLIITKGLKYSILFLIGLIFLLSTISSFAMTSYAHTKAQQQGALVHDLLHIGATHIYSDYWTCNRIAFQSNEQIICSVLDERLQPGLDRYMPYRSIVRSDAHAAYVFPISSPQATVFASKVAASNEHYRRFAFDGYVVYQPS